MSERVKRERESERERERGRRKSERVFLIRLSFVSVFDGNRSPSNLLFSFTILNIFKEKRKK